MREGVDAVYTTRKPLRGLLCDSFRGVVDAADGVEHPQFIPGSDAAIGPFVAFERGKREGGSGKRGDGVWGVAVIKKTGQCRFQILTVNPLATRDLSRGHADRHTVLRDRLLRLEVRQRDLVASGNILARDN